MDHHSMDRGNALPGFTSFECVRVCMTAFDFEGLLALRNAPRPYFFGLAIIFVESMSYISSTLILTAYLSAELGFSDKQAGWIYTVFGMACSLVSILGGFVIDKFGVRATLLTGSIALAISRFAMALTGNGSVFVFFLISCLPIGSTLCYVTMLTGIKRWTSLETRAFGFSMFYIAMNFGALLGGLFTDAMRHSVGYDHCALPSATTHAPHKLWLASPMSDSPFAFTPIPSATTPHVWSDTALSHDISSAFGSTVVSGLLGASASMSYYDSNHTMEAWMINHAVQFPLSPLQTHSLKFASSPALFTKTSHSKLPNMLFRNGATGVDLSKAQAAKPKKTFLGVPLSDAYRLVFLFGALSTLFIFPIVYFFIPEITVDERTGVTADFQPTNDSPGTIFRSVIKQSSFWKLIALVSMLIGIKQVHRQLDAMLPKYLMRSVGCDASFGTIFAINPFLVIATIPFATALASASHPVTSIQVGSILVTAAPFIFVVAASPSFFISCLFVILLSLGEALIAPRLNEYAASIAPIGREGTYLALGHSPNFLGKMLSGFSGELLNSYCPCFRSVCEPCCQAVLAAGQIPCPSGRKLWLFVGAVSLVSAVLIFLFRDWLRQDESHPGYSYRPAATDASGTVERVDTAGDDDNEESILLSAQDQPVKA